MMEMAATCVRCAGSTRLARPPCKSRPSLASGGRVCVNRVATTRLGGAERHCKSRFHVCQAKSEDKDEEGKEDGFLGMDKDDWISTIGTFGLYFLFVGYNTILAPNQTPYLDKYLVQKMLMLVDDDFVVNKVFADVFQAFPIITSAYAAVLIPSARSANKIPAWPFVSASFIVGGFALFPYFALWKPDGEVQAPPAKEEMEGLSGLGLRISESRYFGIFLALASVYYIGDAALAGGEEWSDFIRLFSGSRFTHATVIDFVALNLLIPFWISIDAAQRRWGPDKEVLVNILSYIPLVGPGIYLALRPKPE